MPKRKYTKEEARKRKNIRQAEYSKRTGYTSNKEYNEKNVTTVTIRFAINTENDMIEYLNKQPNKSGYIKFLIKNDIKKKNLQKKY